MPILADHSLAFMIGFALPVFGFPAWGRLRRQAVQGRSGGRKQLYLLTLTTEWILFLLLLGLWLFTDRPFSALGLSVPLNLLSVLVMIIVAAVSLAFIRQWIHVIRLKGAFPDELKAGVRPHAGIIPQNREERRLFALMCLTAGICEEILYRGFIIWYFSFHMHTAIAAIVSAFIFGIAHGYQGAAGLWKTMFFGIVLAALYLISGSLLGPMILHAINNLSTGFIASEILKQSYISRGPEFANQ